MVDMYAWQKCFGRSAVADVLWQGCFGRSALMTRQWNLHAKWWDGMFGYFVVCVPKVRFASAALQRVVGEGGLWVHGDPLICHFRRLGDQAISNLVMQQFGCIFVVAVALLLQLLAQTATNLWGHRDRFMRISSAALGKVLMGCTTCRFY